MLHLCFKSYIMPRSEESERNKQKWFLTKNILDLPQSAKAALNLALQAPDGL